MNRTGRAVLWVAITLVVPVVLVQGLAYIKDVVDHPTAERFWKTPHAVK